MKRRILVTDDEQRLAKSLTALLRGLGYHVDSAIGGAAAIDALSVERYDLVITDLRMPEVDGFDVIKHIGRHCPRTAVIVITGHASTESAIEAIHCHVADYIPKPFDFDLLKSSVEKVFARQEAEKLKEDLSRMFSHDIKVPLTTVIGFADFLLQPDGSLHPRAPEYASKIRSNSRRILALIENYLTSSRVDEGRLEVQSAPLDLAEVVREAIRMMEPEFEAKAFKCRIDIPAEMPFCGDESLLFRAVSNLLANAAKYAPEGAEVWIELSRNDQGGAKLVVGNSGSSVPLAESTRIFDRNHRYHTNTTATGHGLGLSIVAIAANAHRGRAICLTDPAASRIEFEVQLGAPP